jgi:hypothetical protein
LNIPTIFNEEIAWHRVLSLPHFRGCKKYITVSVPVYHALRYGIHVGQIVDEYQTFMNEK